MEKAHERRSEQRLRYRWPVRFAPEGKNKHFQDQIFDISSRGMAFLCHAGQNCPKPGQLLNTNFSVPHFEQETSFDTVLFERSGCVCRVDKPSSKVHLVAVNFSQPLFFKPGEQGISDSAAQQRLEAKNISITKTGEKTEIYSKALIDAEKIVKAETKARVKAETLAKKETRLRLEAENKLRQYEEEIDRLKAEAADTTEKVKVKPKDKTKKSAGEDLLTKFDKFISDRNKVF